MPKPTMRPTFELNADDPPEQVVEALGRAYAAAEPILPAQCVGNHITVAPPTADQHLWSPWLNLEVHPHEGGARVLCRFSPHPNLWTIFMFCYFGLGTIGVFAGFWGMSQMMLDATPFALWITLACAVLAALLFWGSQIGQRLAHDQMRLLRSATESAISSSAELRM